MFFICMVGFGCLFLWDKLYFMKKIVFFFCLVTTVVTILCSCSGKISREKAKELIIAHEKLPKTVSNYVAKSCSYCSTCSREENIATSADAILFDKMLDGKINNDMFVFTDNGNNIYDSKYTAIGKAVSLTEKGKKYLLEEDGGSFVMKLCDITFGEITGMVIDENNKNAKVEYTLKNENITPLGDIYKSSGLRGLINVINQTESKKYTANFIKYDDGWRMQ